MMKKLLAILICVCEPSWASISFVNSAVGLDLSGTALASLSAGALNVTAGNLLVVGVTQDTDSTVPTSVTDTAGNTFVHAAGADNNWTSGDLLTVWYVLSAAGNSNDVVKANFNGNHAFDSIIVLQYSTTGSGFSLDTTATGAASNTGPEVTGTFSTSVANEVIVLFGPGGSPLQGFSLGSIGGTTATNLVADDGANTGAETGSENLIVTATQSSITAGIGISGGSRTWGASAITFSAPAGGAAGFNKQRRLQKMED